MAIAQPHPPRRERPVSQRPATVLICDNEDAIRRLVRYSLELGDYTFVEASDGDEAVALAREHLPDVIVLDMMMPGRSGLDVLRELNADPDLANTPVVMLTARAQVMDRDEAVAAGAARFVAKPFKPDDLAGAVADVLRDRS